MMDMENMEELLQRIFDKIDGLEKKLDEVLQNQHQVSPKQAVSSNTAELIPNYIPETDFHQWIQSFVINEQDVMGVLENRNMFEGFKTCLHKHMCDVECAPVFVQSKGVGGKVKQIFIYYLVSSITNDFSWRTITDNDIYLLIEIIWKKMLQYYFFDMEEGVGDLTEDEQLARDANKKILIDMKQKLVNKHVDIIRFMGQNL